MDLTNAQKEHKEDMYGDLPWRAWGSWFSWGSPVGLGLGWALITISTGVLILLLHTAGVIG